MVERVERGIAWLRQLKGRARLAVLRHRLGPASARGRWLAIDLRARGRTVVSRRRLESLYRICSDARLAEGALVECGVGRAGCTAVMAYAGGPQRAVWGFDSFEGMPPLSPEDEGSGQEWVGYRVAGATGIDDARTTLRLYGTSARFVAGWFEETLPSAAPEIGPIAVLRLDNDWYKSTRYCLEQLYGQVVAGGVVIIDDYHTFQGCRKAVDEFRERLRIDAPMVTTEATTEAYWIKR